MCSFFAVNEPVEDVRRPNLLSSRRGPDATHSAYIQNWTFVHNLLSITGVVRPQPFVNESRSIVCLFNGEIYNWEELGIPAQSDGDVLIPLYEQHGAEYVKKLDGEFAIALFDFQKNKVIVSTDAFATKPLWYAHDGRRFAAASYKSTLSVLGFGTAQKVPANTTITFNLSDFSELCRTSYFDFDPTRQYKEHVDDYLAAFSDSIRKRTNRVREKIFIGLSSGYDSGAIACELEKQHTPFRAYSIMGREIKNVLNKRHERIPRGLGTKIDAGYWMYRNERIELSDICEPFRGTLQSKKYGSRDILDDAGAIGLGIICKRARIEGCKIYLSGQGADEILSDYRTYNFRRAGHSTLPRMFPDDLEPHFPWHNFYGGAQEFYIAKEEHVAGAYGIEARYPFLDPALVQEFLFLSPAIKNAGYKYPLEALFNRYDYPYEPNVKIGFVPRKKTATDYLGSFFDKLFKDV